MLDSRIWDLGVTGAQKGGMAQWKVQSVGGLSA